MNYTLIPGTHKRVIILFHGTGGSATDLLGIGQILDEHASLLGTQGDVFENGMRRYFARYPDGSFDLESLKENTDKIHADLQEILVKEQRDQHEIIALGYSNGANLILNLMREYKDNVFSKVILFHPSSAREEIPYIQENIDVFMTSGKQDPYITKDEFKQMQKDLKKTNNKVKTFTHDLGHQLIQEELIEAKVFLGK